MSDSPSPIYVCGPTASGKTQLALELAAQHNGEIINADALQLYRGLEIISAAPSREELEKVPHHLFGILDPSQTNDAQSYATLAAPVIAAISARGHTPIVTGGSGLYLKFLTHGASPLPSPDPALRAELDATPLDELVRQLQELDPVEAARTSLHNPRYVSRAVEICRLTGQRASKLRDQWATATEQRTRNLHGYVIQRTRPDLHARIAKRTRAMLEGGAIEEVRSLGEISEMCEKAIGVREIRSLLREEIDRSTCEDLINAATRQYAKRQETWFRRETWLRPVNGEG